MPLTLEQREFRQGKVTASAMPAILGIDPYGRTLHDVFREARHMQEKKETTAIRFGNHAEPFILQLMAEKKGLVLSTGATYQDDERPWLAATPDSMVLDRLHPVAPCEAKAVGFRAMRLWGEDETDQIPDYVTVQCTTQMIVTKTKRCFVGALLGTDFRMYEVEYSDTLANMILEGADNFWKKHLEPGVMPPLDGSDNAYEMIQAEFGRVRVGVVRDASPQQEEWASRIFEIRAKMAELETEKSTLDQNLRVSMIGCDKLRSPKGGWRMTAAERAPTIVEAYEKKGYTHFDMRKVKN